MKKFNVFAKIAVAAVLLATALVFTGCKPEVQFRDKYVDLVGTWAAGEYEQYIITYDGFESVNTYKCNSIVIKQIDSKSGYIYGKYTLIPDWTKGQEEEPADKTGWLYTYGKWYPSNSELIGKWYAAYYSDLTSGSLKYSGAFKADGVSGTETLEEAIETFTVENGYFALPSECIKVTNTAK